MRRFCLLLLVPVVALGQGLNTSPPGMARNSPLISASSGMVSHVIWNGSSLVDLVPGVTWTQNGTVQQIAPGAFKPPPGRASAGPYSTTNSYDAGAGAPFVFAGDFSACVVFKATNLTAAQYLFGKDQSGARDFSLYLTATSGRPMAGIGAMSVGALNGAVAGAVSVACMTYRRVADGTSVLTVRLDGGAEVQATNAAIPAGGASKMYLGRIAYVGFESPFAGVIYEFAAWDRELPSSETLAIQAAVMKRVR